MADLISRAAAIEAVYYKPSHKMAIEVLKEVPAVDAVPVEWLKKVRKDASEGDSLDVGIAEVLDMWEKERSRRL